MFTTHLSTTSFRQCAYQSLLLAILFGVSSCGGSSNHDLNNPAASLSDIRINEVDSDSLGADSAEFIELYNSSSLSLDLSQTVLVFYNGDDNSVYNSIDLDGENIAAGAYFVIGNAATPNVDLIFADNALQNGTDAIALYHGDTTDFPNGQSINDASTEIIDALVYDTSDADNSILVEALTSGQAQIDEDADSNAADVSMQRIPDGAGAAQATNTYQLYVPTPGTANAAVTPIIAPIGVAWQR